MRSTTLRRASSSETRAVIVATPQSRPISIVICAGLAVMTWLVFGQTRAYPFINYDDPGYVYENPHVFKGFTKESVAWAFTGTHGANWHPLTSLSHILDCQLFGLWAGGHHMMNLVLHALAAVLLFLALRHLTGALWQSAFVAGVFAMHPLRVESVAWISERKDVLSGVFFMLGLGAYAFYARKPSVVRYLWVAFFFTLGLLSKSMLVTFPAVLFLLDYWPLRRLTNRRSVGLCVLEKLPLIGLAVLSGVFTIAAQRVAIESSDTLPLLARLANACVSYFTYIREMFVPTDLAVFYPHPGGSLPTFQVVASLLFLIGVSVVAIIARKRSPFLLTGWLWYLIMLLPVIGITQAGLQGHADRYTYLPQIGLYLLCAFAIGDLLKRWQFRRYIFAIGTVIIVGALAWTASAQTRYWRDSEDLWRHALEVTTNNDVAHINLAAVLLQKGRPLEAIPHCDAAIKIWPADVQAYNNRALAFTNVGEDEQAVSSWRKSLQLKPDGLKAQTNLAWLLATSPIDSVRNGTEAVRLAEAANEQTNGSDVTVLRTLAAAYAETDRFDDAVATVEHAAALATAQGDGDLSSHLQFQARNYRAHLRLRDTSRTRRPVAPAQQ